VPKATNVTPGSSAPTARKTSTERKTAKVVESAQAEARRIRAAAAADAARMRAEAEEHAHGLVLDARATADGVRAEGMELVSNLREMSDSLRVNAERLLADIQSIHARMVGELERVDPGTDSIAPGTSGPEAESESSIEDELDVPDFVQRR